MNKKNPIHIKPENKGKLTREIGKKGLKNLPAEEKKAKAAGNTALEKRIVFARNAKLWRHPGA